MATYEIKVEHQVPKEAISSPSEEMVTESVLAEVKTTRSSKDSVLFIKEEKVNVVATTTTTIVQEQPPLTASMSLTTFGSRPVRSTLPMSSSPSAVVVRVVCRAALVVGDGLLEWSAEPR